MKSPISYFLSGMTWFLYWTGTHVDDGDKYLRSFTSQIAPFCGSKEKCSQFGSKDALKEAKRNVEKYYAVVGVAEEMENSMVVFEKYIPKYFKNALRFYHEFMRDTENQGMNKNIFQPPRIPQYIISHLMKNFSLEIDFYTFCKARLKKQYISLL